MSFILEQKETFHFGFISNKQYVLTNFLFFPKLLSFLCHADLYNYGLLQA